MQKIPILATLTALCAAALLASCAWSPDSNWFLMDSGYSINAADSNAFAVEVHLNQLKRLGGEINSAEFRSFVFERLKWHEPCAGGWELLPCVADGSCVQHTSRSITVFARCAAS
jgi:hypothetical protein